MRRLVLLLLLCLPALAYSPAPFGAPPVGHWRDGLVAVYPMDTGAGTVVHDLSGRDRHLSISGSNVSWGTSHLAFANGTGSLVKSSDTFTELEYNRQWTVVFWCRRLAASDYHTCVSQQVDSSTYRGFNTRFNSDNTFVFGRYHDYNTNEQATSTTTTTFSAGIWYMMACVAVNPSSTGGRIYANGQLQTVTNVGLGLTDTIIPSDIEFEIGGRGNSTSYTYPMDGDIGPVWIYNRALTPSEIRQLYINPNAPFEPSPRILPGMAYADGGGSSVPAITTYYRRLRAGAGPAAIPLVTILFLACVYGRERRHAA